MSNMPYTFDKQPKQRYIPHAAKRSYALTGHCQVMPRRGCAGGHTVTVELLPDIKVVMVLCDTHRGLLQRRSTELRQRLAEAS